MKFHPRTVAFTAALGALPIASEAALSIIIQEVGPDVVVSASGSANLADLGAPDGTAAFSPFMIPSQGELRLGTDGSGDIYTTVSSPGGFGSGTSFAFPTSSSGDFVGLTSTSASQLIVPAGYVSGDPLSGSSTYASASIASLGLTPGTYAWTWGSGVNEDSASLTIVPEPATFGLFFGLSVLGFLAVRRRR